MLLHLVIPKHHFTDTFHIFVMMLVRTGQNDLIQNGSDKFVPSFDPFLGPARRTFFQSQRARPTVSRITLQTILWITYQIEANGTRKYLHVVLLIRVPLLTIQRQSSLIHLKSLHFLTTDPITSHLVIPILFIFKFFFGFGP